MIRTCAHCGAEDSNSNQVHYVLTFHGMQWMCERCIPAT